jgi:archaellum biogenesis ATPase FlaH
VYVNRQWLCKAPVIIIDYLRKLRTDKAIGDERLRVNEILSRLREIADKYNTPVLTVSELARDSYVRVRNIQPRVRNKKSQETLAG